MLSFKSLLIIPTALYCLTSLSSATIAAESRSDYFTTIYVDNGHPGGKWKSMSFCQEGSYASGLNQEVQPPQGDGDDEAVIGVGLACHVRGIEDSINIILSVSGSYGEWGIPAYCGDIHSDYITGFQLKVEKGTSDDSAVNSVAGYCNGAFQGNTSYWLESSAQGSWGSWGSKAFCPRGTAVCGITVKDDPFETNRAGIKDVAMACCTY